MKKYIISASLLVLAVSSVYAETETQAKPRPVVTGMRMASTTMTRIMPAMAVANGLAAKLDMPQMPVTGDAATDAAIKALHTEMEAKIKAIRDDYQAKIKVAIGTKKIINRTEIASSTREREMMRDGSGKPLMNGSTSMRRMEDGDKINGSSTAGRPGEDGRPPQKNPGYGRPQTAGQVRGAEVSADMEDKPGIFGFFSKMFTR